MASDREWVRAVLSNWAAWVVQRADGGVGYPTVNILARQGGSSATTDRVPLAVQQAEVVDQAMAELRRRDIRAWLLLMLRYVGSPFEVARKRRPMEMSAICYRLGGVSHDHAAKLVRDAEDLVAELLARDRRMV